MNTMTINGYQAVIAFDPDIQMFRGEFVALNGGRISTPRMSMACAVKARFRCRSSLKPVLRTALIRTGIFPASFRCASILRSTRPPPLLPLLRA